MKLEQIQQVLEISQAGSINKAAKNLFTSQPNLSASLKSLEQELNVKLFTRTQQGMVLTPKGQQFLYFSAPVLKQFNQVADLLQTLSGDSRKMFRISNVYIPFVETLFLEIIEQFGVSNLISLYRDVNLAKATDDIAKQLTDIAVVCFNNTQRCQFNAACEYKNLVYTPLMECRMSVIMRKEHPLAHSGKKSLSPCDLLPYYTVAYGSRNDSKLESQQLLSVPYGRQAILVNSRACLLETLRKTDTIYIAPSGISLHPDSSRYDDLVDIPLKHSEMTAEIGILRGKNFVTNPMLDQFLLRLHQITQAGIPTEE